MTLRITPRKGETLEIGTNGKGMVVVCHPYLVTDSAGRGFIEFSPEQAESFAWTLQQKAKDARLEKPTLTIAAVIKS